MRISAFLIAVALVVGASAHLRADDAAEPSEMADTAAQPPKDYAPCTCGGPKAIYAAQYGTVQPPIYREMNEEKAAEEADTQPAAASPSPESDAADGG